MKCTMEYCWPTKKKMRFCHFETTWMDLEGIMLSERSQTEKDKYYMLSLIYGNQTKGYNKTETDLHRENKLQLTVGRGNSGKKIVLGD